MTYIVLDSKYWVRSKLSLNCFKCKQYFKMNTKERWLSKQALLRRWHHCKQQLLSKLSLQSAYSCPGPNQYAYSFVCSLQAIKATSQSLYWIHLCASLINNLPVSIYSFSFYTRQFALFSIAETDFCVAYARMIMSIVGRVPLLVPRQQYIIWITSGLKLDKRAGEKWSNLSPSEGMKTFTTWYVRGKVFTRSL